MSVLIVIHYLSNDQKVMQRGTFPLKGRPKEVVAYEFLRWIRREMPYGAEVEKVLCDDEDITELVKKLDEAPLD